MAKNKSRRTETPARKKAIADYRKARRNVMTRIRRYEREGLTYSGEIPETAAAIKKLSTPKIKSRAKHIKQELTPSKTLGKTVNELGVSGFKVRHARRVEAGKKSQEWTEERQRKRDKKYKKKIKKMKQSGKAPADSRTVTIDNFRRCINGSLMSSNFSDAGTMVLHALETSITNDGADKTADKISDMWDLIQEYFSSLDAMYDNHTPDGITDAAKTVTKNLQGELSEEQEQVFDDIAEDGADANEGIIGGDEDKQTLSSGIESAKAQAKAFLGRAIDNKRFSDIWVSFNRYISEDDRYINMSSHLSTLEYLLGILKDKKATRQQIFDAEMQIRDIIKGV